MISTPATSLSLSSTEAGGCDVLGGNPSSAESGHSGDGKKWADFREIYKGKLTGLAD